MNKICQNAEEFLIEMVDDFGFDLEVTSTINEDEGCVFDFSGPDVSFVLSDNGEMLDAFETLLFQVYGRELERKHRFICDAEGFRQTRKQELYAMANFAANSVREKGLPFTFGVLSSSERRAIHLALEKEDDLTTESVGDGRERRLQVKFK
ncbi:MAG: protein jag [Pyrinomonadaceae bacterium]